MMFKKISTITFSFLLVLIMMTGCSSSPTTGANEPQWPDRKVDLVVPYGVGGGMDTTMRAFAPILEKELGVPVVITNIEGSGALKGMEYVNNQPADGYTLLAFSPTHLLASIQNLSEVDIMEDFVPVSRLVCDVLVVTGSPKGRFQTFEEVVSWSKENPGDVKIGGLTPKGIDAIGIRMIGEAAGVDMTFIPFDGGAEVKAAMLGGHIDISNDDPINVLPLVKSGDLKALVVANKDRLPGFPDTPSTFELGLEVEAGTWRALAFKKGTPEEAMKGMEAAIASALITPEWKEFEKKNMLDQKPGYANIEEFSKLIQSEYKYFEKAFAELGL